MAALATSDLPDLRLLGYFLSLVDTGTVTAAARQLHVAQPSLSRQIRRLENDLGLTLFDRVAGRLMLTPAGEQFVPAARDLIFRAESLKSLAATLAAGRLDRIRIAAPSTTMTDVIAPFIATFSPGDPFPVLVEADPADVYSALTSQADLAICADPPPKGATATVLATLPIWAYVPPTHRWARRTSITIHELSEETALLLPDKYKARQILDQALAHQHQTLPKTIEVTSPQTSQALAAAGRGVAVVSDDKRFDLHPLHIQTRGGHLTLQLHAAWNTNHHAAAVIENLTHRLRGYCSDRYGGDGQPAHRTEA